MRYRVRSNLRREKILKCLIFVLCIVTGCREHSKTKPAQNPAQQTVPPSVREAQQAITPFLADARQGNHLIVTVKNERSFVQLDHANDGWVWIEVPLKLVSDGSNKSEGEIAHYDARSKPPVFEHPDSDEIVPKSKIEELRASFSRYDCPAKLIYHVNKDGRDYHEVLGGYADTSASREISQLIVELFQVLTSQQAPSLIFE